ncbi:MAG TPA: tyrosine--tRNA ligase, partial [Bacteroidia bacterium]
MNFIEELRWRGMLQDIMPGTEELLNKEMVSGYVGFDPTADSLHMGNMVSVLLLARLQKAGHKPYALVGGATGMIGDPSGKSQERNLLDEDLLRHNVECIKKQLSRFLDFENGENKAVLVNNYDWIKDFTLLSFLRDVGKHLTVNYMLSKDSVQKRLETGLSFTEFSYQLIQGYDFYHLYKNHGIKLQMGGSDQWGNIVSGTELIRRMAGGEAFAATAPLLTKADGTKFGKSEQGNIWIDANKTSPYKFYQFWLNVGDEEAVKLIKVFTFLPKEEIDALTAAHLEAPHLRILQKRLAEEVTVWIHSKEALQKAQAASDILFGKGTAEGLKALSESEILDIFEG